MSIKSKIKALLAKAEGTDNNLEAAAFMAKVEQLLEAHNLQLHELGDETDLVTNFVGLKTTRSHPVWVRRLHIATAIYYGCKSVTSRRGRDITVTLIGRQSALDTYELMIEFIIEQVKTHARAMIKEVNVNYPKAQSEIGNALTSRIHTLTNAQQERQAEQNKARGFALVPVDQIEAARAALFPNLRNSKPTNFRPVNAQAIERAGQVSLHRQTGSTQALRLGRS